MVDRQEKILKLVSEYHDHFLEHNNIEDLTKRHHDIELSQEQLNIAKDIFKEIQPLINEETIEELCKKSSIILYTQYSPKQLYYILSPELYDLLMTASEYI